MFHSLKHAASLDLGRYTVRAVARSLGLLELLRDSHTPLSLREISRRLGTAKSSSFRLLRTLEPRGYVERDDDDGRYQLGPAWMTYSGRLPAHRALSEIALPHMQALRERFAETVNLGVLRQGEIYYLEMLESPRSFRMAAAAGTCSPIHSTALGKAIAAHLTPDQVETIVRRRKLTPLTPRTITTILGLHRELASTRRRGYAEDNGETYPEASCIGAPIFDATGQAVAAISISGPTSRIRAIKAEAARALVDACTIISRKLGFARTQTKRRSCSTARSGSLRGEGVAR